MDEIFLKRKEEVSEIIGHVSAEKQNLEVQIGNPKETLAKLKRESQDIAHYLFTQSILRLHDTKFLEKSPFFVRLTVQFEDKAEQEKIYIGKFSFLPDKIYSWTAPVAGLRFNTPGSFSYTRPNGQIRSGVLINREDYFISNGKIVSLYGVTQQGRDLIYDEYISVKKTGFGLSDIVRELERAQNEIIVLDPRGCMVISGPAGSGKTTLALHRVAYLLQNPDTSEIYKPENTIIFIQDESSIEYFSSLFVNLGVGGVRFTTFEKWCVSVLGLDSQYGYVDRYGENSLEQDWYEWNKVVLIKEISLAKYSSEPINTLDAIYKNHSDSLFKKLWNNQKSEGVIDNQDLTALLKIQMQSNKDNKVFQPSRVWKKKLGKMVPVNTRSEVLYDVLLVDEFENYTADQLQILNTTLSQKASCLFVGDINQQTRLGSISDFSQSSITIPQNRNIILNKVYRNSSAVLEILQLLGYKINIENKNNLTGSANWKTDSFSEFQSHLEDYLKNNQDEQVGVVCYDADKTETIKKQLAVYSGKVHVGTVKEFQGLEFDTVFIIDVNKDLFKPSDLHAEFDNERSQILREQLYVALTRARNNVVIYSDSEQGIIKDLIN
jgi:DNA helicase IV